MLVMRKDARVNRGCLNIQDIPQTKNCLFVNAMQHGMIWVGQAEMVAGTTPADVNRLSSNTGVMSQSDQKKSPAEAPPAGDLKTGELFGKRFAETTARFVNGKA